MSDQPDNKPAVPDLSGRIGKYEIVRPLGKGAMGQVYVAHDTILDRDVALKVMVAQIADDPELKQRFEREARAVAKMTHPNVVMVFDLGNHTDGSPFIAMELLKGLDLQKAVRQPPPMSVDKKVAIIVQVLQGLAHAHQAGIVHRDIKPANIFIQQDGSVKIMDFGVARLTTASMTGTGNIVGTADYMSPEQVKGSKVDGRSDVFSVGCMLYEMMAGRRPFHSDNLMAIFYKITHEEPNFDLIPTGLEYDALLPILKKSLAKDLPDRFQTAYDFAVALRDWLKVHATAAAGNVLEQIGEMEAPPTSPPQPLTDASGATVVPAQPGEVSDVGTGRRQMTAPGARPGARPAAGAASQRGAAAAPTVIGVGPGQTLRPGATRIGGAAAPTVVRPTRPAPSSGGHPGLYIVLGGMFVALVGTGYILWTKMNPPPPPITLASMPPTTAPAPTTLATPTPPPPTAAPPPTFAEVKGKGATAMKTAQTAFSAGNYDRALTAAQDVLREDPGNADAKRMAENALSGQKATARLHAAEAALRQGDMATATAEAEGARTLAPWDGRVTDMIVRIRDAQAQAERERERKAQSEQTQKQQLLAAQVNKYVNDASTAFGNKQYDAAIKLYDEALKLDSSNVAAIQGRTGAITARALSETPGPRDPGRSSGHGFTPGKTTATSGEAKTTGAPPDFEESAGVTVKSASTTAALPGKILFEVSPDGVKAGDRYVVNIQLANEGDAPIQIRAMQLTTTVNGRKSQGPVPTLTKDVAPKQKALLYKLEGEIWKEDTSSWSMEAIVTTVRGETYRNNVSWK
jgi:serine/threonine-protein kinase